jgi:hypothetical protein
MTAVMLLAKLLALQGEWTAREEGKDHPATFETVAKGTALVQRSGYMAVYSLDGDALLATVWVDDGFSGRFRAKGKGLSDKVLVFELVELANRGAAANGYADRMEIELVDADHVVQRWRWKPPKGAPMTIAVELHRGPSRPAK